MVALVTRVTDLAVRVATEFKALRTLINGNAADLTALSTTAKGNLVLALNELKTTIDSVAAAGGATINDASSASTVQTWSITKISSEITAALNALTTGAPTALNTLDELAAALGDDANFASTITTALGNRLRTDVANQGLTVTQQNNAGANLGIGNPDTDFVTTFNTNLV